MDISFLELQLKIEEIAVFIETSGRGKCVSDASAKELANEVRKFKSFRVTSGESCDTPERMCLHMIVDVSIGYDGYGTVESLKGLVDEMAAYARMGLKGEKPYV